MKHVKRFVLVAVVATVMTAAGAGSGSATVLCETKTNTSTCQEHTYPSGTVFNLSQSESATFGLANGTILDTCRGSNFKGKTTTGGNSSETVSLTVESLTWSECTSVFSTIAGGSLEIHWISGTDNGTLTGRETSWTYLYPGGFDCIYGFASETDLGTITGGSPAAISINRTIPKLGGNAACPAEIRWIAGYRFTEPTPLYFARGEGSPAAILCKAKTNTTTCPEPYSSGRALEASLKSETAAVLEAGSTVLDTCTGTTLKGEVTNVGSAVEAAKASIEELAWSGCTKTTDTSLAKGSFELDWIKGTDNGTLTASGTRWTINTIFGTCTYGYSSNLDLGTLSGGNPATISVNAIIPKLEGNGLCPPEARWTATYAFTELEPLYFTEGY